MCPNTTDITNTSCKVDVFQGLAYCPLFLLGFLVNAAGLRVFIAKRDSWTETHVYMFNLALADSAFILFLPFRIYDAFFCMPKTLMCTFLIYIHFINMYASILTTAAISVQRYLAIRFPLQARSWRKKKEVAFSVCVIMWVLLVTVCGIFQRENYPDKLWTCYERCKNLPLQPHFIFILVFVGFLTPFLIMVFCSAHIISILFKMNDQSGEKKSTIGVVTANMLLLVVCKHRSTLAFLSTTSTFHVQTGSIHTYPHMAIYWFLNGLLPQTAALIPSAIIFYWYSFIRKQMGAQYNPLYLQTACDILSDCTM